MRRLASALALAALALGASASAGPQPGTCPRDPGLGQLAFLRGGTLHLFDFTTCRERVLVRRGATAVSFSPDARFIAFGGGVVASRGGRVIRAPWVGFWAPRGHLMAATTRGGGVVVGGPGIQPRRLVPDGFGTSSLAWAPDGGALGVVRSSARKPYRHWIWLLHLATGSSQLVAGSFPDTKMPTLVGFSPDGAWILWQSLYDRAISANLDGVPLLAERVAGGAGPLRVVRFLLRPDYLTWCGPRPVIAAGPDRYATHSKRLVVVAPPSGGSVRSRATRRGAGSPRPARRMGASSSRAPDGTGSSGGSASSAARSGGSPSTGASAGG